MAGRVVDSGSKALEFRVRVGGLRQLEPGSGLGVSLELWRGGGREWGWGGGLIPEHLKRCVKVEVP